MIHLVQKLPENIVGSKASSGVTETVMSNFQKLAVSTTLKNIVQWQKEGKSINDIN